MSRFTLYHLMSEFARDAYTRVETSLSRYTLVATVEAHCHQEVFELTNHGVPGRVDNWTDGACVIELFTPKNRTWSTSVGDVVSDETGTCYRCEPSGWTIIVVDEGMK